MRSRTSGIPTGFYLDYLLGEDAPDFARFASLLDAFTAHED